MEQDPALAGANLTISVLFVFTGLDAPQGTGATGVAWALMLAGLLRSLDFVDAWSGPRWAIYDLLFGAADRFSAPIALLRYPNPALLRAQRLFLVLLAGWMLVGRVLIMVTATRNGTALPRRPGGPPWCRT